MGLFRYKRVFLGLFVNTLTADDKYSICNTLNLQQPIQMQLSKKFQQCLGHFNMLFV